MQVICISGDSWWWCLEGPGSKKIKRGGQGEIHTHTHTHTHTHNESPKLSREEDRVKFTHTHNESPKLCHISKYLTLDLNSLVSEIS